MQSGANILRKVFIVAGSLSLVLGITGIFFPLLPTTPFLLLAAACYARGSERFYNWLLSNRYFGKHIRNYREERGVPFKLKMLGVFLLWLSIGFSATFAVDTLTARIVLVVLAIVISGHILHLRTLSD